MSRTNKGGARLRLITGLTAAMAIAAGVFAAHSFKPLDPFACYFDNASAGTSRLAVKAGNSVVIKCPDANALATYDLVFQGSGWSGSAPQNVDGDTLSTTGVTLSTDGTIGSSASSASVDVKEDGMNPVVGASSTLEILKLSYTNTASNVNGGSPARVVVAGLISGTNSYTIEPIRSSSIDLSGWDTSLAGSGADVSHPASFNGTSGKFTLYKPSSTTADNYMGTVNPGSTVNNISYNLRDGNGNLIENFATVTITHMP